MLALYGAFSGTHVGPKRAHLMAEVMNVTTKAKKAKTMVTKYLTARKYDEER